MLAHQHRVKADDGDVGCGGSGEGSRRVARVTCVEWEDHKTAGRRAGDDTQRPTCFDCATQASACQPGQASQQAGSRHAPAARAPRMTQGAYAMYSRLDTRLNTMQARQWMGSRLAMKE